VFFLSLLIFLALQDDDFSRELEKLTEEET
jgi:hypothetical protein